jgi:hypothetical protein
MEVQVFEGKIELHDPAARRKPATALTTGQSVRVENGNRIDPIKLDPTGFPTANEVAAESQKELLRRKKAWADLSATLQKDPSLVAYFPFEIDKARDRTLADRSVGAAKSHDGAIVGSAWGAGRWDGRSGLEFKQVSDRVRFHIKEEVQSITMMAWVRIDGLPNENNSLLMSDGWDPGGLHWQIGADGTLVLGVQSQPKSGGHYHAPQAITPEHFGQWLHLAVVYDRDKKEVSHWINGARAAEPWPLQFDIPLRVGAAEIGNWNIAMHRNKSPIRFFSGCMDEFLIFSRALPDVELTRIYTESRPPS